MQLILEKRKDNSIFLNGEDITRIRWKRTYSWGSLKRLKGLEKIIQEKYNIKCYIENSYTGGYNPMIKYYESYNSYNRGYSDWYYEMPNDSLEEYRFAFIELFELIKKTHLKNSTIVGRYELNI